jgi:hypothetical protein
MIAFVDLIHALPIRGRKVSNSWFQREFCIKGRKIGRNAFDLGGACIHAFGSSFSPEF